MKKTLLTLMICGAFFAITPSFCMEDDNKRDHFRKLRGDEQVKLYETEDAVSIFHIMNNTLLTLKNYGAFFATTLGFCMGEDDNQRDHFSKLRIDEQVLVFSNLYETEDAVSMKHIISMKRVSKFFCDFVNKITITKELAVEFSLKMGDTVTRCNIPYENRVSAIYFSLFFEDTNKKKPIYIGDFNMIAMSYRPNVKKFAIILPHYVNEGTFSAKLYKHTEGRIYSKLKNSLDLDWSQSRIEQEKIIKKIEISDFLFRNTISPLQKCINENPKARRDREGALSPSDKYNSKINFRQYMSDVFQKYGPVKLFEDSMLVLLISGYPHTMELECPQLEYYINSKIYNNIN